MVVTAGSGRRSRSLKIDFKKLAGETYSFDNDEEDDDDDVDKHGNGYGDGSNNHLTYANKNIKKVLQRSFTDATTSTSKVMQIIEEYEGGTLTAENLLNPSHPLSIHKPILIKDTPQSIGMRLPHTCTHVSHSSKLAYQYTIREIGQKIGMKQPISVMDVRTQDELEGWIFADMVDHFEDEDRQVELSLNLMDNAHGEGKRDINGDHANANANISVENDSKGVDMNGNGNDGSNSKSDTEVYANGESKQTNEKDTVTARQNYNQPKVAKTEPRSPSKENIISNNTSTLTRRTTPTRKRRRHISRSRVLNQISLEFSPMPLAKMVRSPQFVRDLDWIEHVWPTRYDYENIHNNGSGNGNGNGNTGTQKQGKGCIEKVQLQTTQMKAIQDYPQVQYYLLTSTAGCYTDFHVDFGGTSVWYHILSGKKVFLLIEPSPDNIALYEKWLCRKDQSDIFFPDMKMKRDSDTGADGDGDDMEREIGVQNCVKMTLQQGQTLIIPTGYIHAVYTPVDSLVIGGNFLHGLDIKGQLDIHCLETRTRVPAKFRFPKFVQLMFYAGLEYFKRLKDPERFGMRLRTRVGTGAGGAVKPVIPVHKEELEGLTVLVQALRSWNIGPGGDSTRFGSVAYVTLECVAELRELFSIESMDNFCNCLEHEVRVATLRLETGDNGDGKDKEEQTIGGGEKSSAAAVLVSSLNKPKPKLKLSIKRKLPPGLNRLPNAKPIKSSLTATLGRSPVDQSANLPLVEKDSLSLKTDKNDTKLHLKLKNVSNVKLGSSISGISNVLASHVEEYNRGYDDDDSEDDDDDFPDLNVKRNSVPVPPLTTISASVPKAPLGPMIKSLGTSRFKLKRATVRTTDLVSSQRMIDDDEWLPEGGETPIADNSITHSVDIIERGSSLVKRKSSGSKQRLKIGVGGVKTKKATGSSRSRLMKKFKS